MAQVRIFSYLPNPRVWKAVIAARLGGVDLEVRGAAGAELVEWPWDFDARPLSKCPPRNAPPLSAWAASGSTAASSTRPTPFLQLSRLERCPRLRRGRAGRHLRVQQHHARNRPRALVGEGVSLADICFACELALFHNELDRSGAPIAFGKAPFLDKARERFPGAMAHFDHLANDPAFAPELGPYLAKFATER